MKELSIFTGFNKVAAVREYETIAELIRSGKYKSKIKSLQRLLSGHVKNYGE